MTTKEKNHLPMWRSFSAYHNQPYPYLCQKKQESFYSWYSGVHFPLVDTVNQKIISCLIVYTFSLQLGNMLFSVSNDGFEWSLDFGADSNTPTVKDLVQGLTKSSQEIPRVARSLLLSPKTRPETIDEYKTFEASNYRKFQLPLSSKEHTKWETRYFQM